MVKSYSLEYSYSSSKVIGMYTKHVSKFSYCQKKVTSLNCKNLVVFTARKYKFSLFFCISPNSAGGISGTVAQHLT